MHVPVILVVIMVGLLFHALMYAGQPAIMAEMFPTRMRYSGVSISYQVTSIVAGSLAPILATTWLRNTGSWWPTAVYLLVAGAVTTVAVLSMRETRGRSLHELALPIGRRHEILCSLAQRMGRPAPDSGLPTGAWPSRLRISTLCPCRCHGWVSRLRLTTVNLTRSPSATSCSGIDGWPRPFTVCANAGQRSPGGRVDRSKRWTLPRIAGTARRNRSSVRRADSCSVSDMGVPSSARDFTY
jgi:MFS family permease